MIEDLTIPGPAPAAAVAAPREARGDVAARLARIAAAVLERQQVGLDQDLFALGADSLRAVELLARVHEEWAVEIGVEELFAAPTVAALAAAVERAAAGGRDGGEAGSQGGGAAGSREGGAAGAGAAGGEREAPLARRPRTAAGEPLPLSFAQRRLWFLHQLEPRNPVHNLAAALRLRGQLSVPALAAAFREIVRRHEVLRTGFAAAGPEPAQVVMRPPPRPAPFKTGSAATMAATLPVIDLASLPAGRGARRGAAAFRHRARPGA
jgi:acyl carrier protein